MCRISRLHEMVTDNFTNILRSVHACFTGYRTGMGLLSSSFVQSTFSHRFGVVTLYSLVPNAKPSPNVARLAPTTCRQLVSSCIPHVSRKEVYVISHFALYQSSST